MLMGSLKRLLSENKTHKKSLHREAFKYLVEEITS